MDTEAFIAWSLDPARTIDERYTVELLVEMGVSHWNSKRKIFDTQTFDQRMALSRERKLNPAYQPQYSEESLAKSVESLAVMKSWWARPDLPIRSLGAFRFLTALESVDIAFAEPSDVSPLADLPSLTKLSLGYPGSPTYNTRCEDFSPLARCTALRKLTLAFNVHWPNLDGLDALTQLESFILSGNLHALPRGIIFPSVRRGGLYCIPLASRNVADLPQFPACEFLTLSGAERLDGIEKMPRLRNLTILGAFQSFTPLESLKELTCLTVTPDGDPVTERQPLDVSPLTRLPKLAYFKIGPPHVYLDHPRDYSPLAEAPALRELVVTQCPPVQMEVAAINAGLQPWDDVLLLPEPRPLPPLRIIVSPHPPHEPRNQEELDPEDNGLIDAGLRECHGRWVQAYAQTFISNLLDNPDWGTIKANGAYRTIHATVESFGVVERLSEIVEGIRAILARLRGNYAGDLTISLRVKPPEATPAQKELEAQFRERQDEWEMEQHFRDRAEYLEKLHQMELKKQEGAEIDPDEFSPAGTQPYPKPPWEEGDEEDEEGGGDDEIGIAIKEKIDPPPSFFDDEHPLAEQYRAYVTVNLEELWISNHYRGIVCHLMQREPDVEIPEEEKP